MPDALLLKEVNDNLGAAIIVKELAKTVEVSANSVVQSSFDYTFPDGYRFLSLSFACSSIYGVPWAAALSNGTFYIRNFASETKTFNLYGFVSFCKIPDS